jgi:hypothetical protein
MPTADLIVGRAITGLGAFVLPDRGTTDRSAKICSGRGGGSLTVSRPSGQPAGPWR